MKSLIHCYKAYFSMMLLFWVQSLNGQDLKLAGFSFTRFPSAVAQDSPANQKIALNEYNFFVNIPKPLKNDKTTLINGVQYRLVSPSSVNDLNSGLDGQKLHLIGYRFTAVHSFDSKWKTIVSLNPTLSSTFDTKLEAGDFLFNGFLLFVREQSDRFSYGGGIAYLSTFGEPGFIPTLQLSYSSDNAMLKVLLPRHITYERYFGKLTAGLKVEASGSRYNVNFTRSNILKELELVDQLAYSRVVIGPVLSYRAVKIIQLEASGGIAVARSVSLQSDRFENENYNIYNGPFFRFGIAIVPPKKEVGTSR